MRVFFSGNEELARYHLPTVQSVANSFAERCKKAGLSQNAMAFSFNDTGAHASIQYVFGQLNVQISAPFTTSEGGTTITETLKSKRAIWIRTFDESVRYSYNGMFFSYHSSIEPIYEPSELKITSVEKKVVTDRGARIVTSWENRDSIKFNHYTEPHGINAAFAECAYQPVDQLASLITKEVVVDGDSYGYPACAFYVPKANEIRWRAGGDAVFKEKFPVVAGEHTFTTTTAFLFNTPGHTYYSDDSFPATYLLGPTKADFLADFGSKMAATGVNPDEAISCYFGHGNVPVTSTQLYLPTDFVCCYYEGTSKTEISITRGPVVDVQDGFFIHGGEILITAGGGGGLLTIKMTDVDGTVISESHPATITDAYSCPSSYYCPFLADGGKAYIYFSFICRGAAVPTVFSGAPRGYLHLVFFGQGHRALAYTKQTGWKKCVPIRWYYSQEYTPVMWIGPYAEGCVQYVQPNTEAFYLTLSYLERSFNVALDRFSYSSRATIKTALGTSPTNVPMGVVIFSENGRYVSLYNCQIYPNGIYDITTGSFNQVHLYDETEIEPIFMDDVAGVICTKRAIYLDHGGRSLLCTECCGMFLDHTHYVDKLADGSFVLNKIVDGDNGLVGVMVDSLPAGAYNFYEFSEDASVCVISNYYMYPEDPQPSSPAIVLDYADPVYRFEPSDQIITQYMRPDIFEPTEENKRLGYPTGIPFGARYVNICACYPKGALKREHSVYCCPKNGLTTTEATINAQGNSSFCPLQPGERIYYRGKFPTIVPQYSAATVNRRDYRYDGERLNRHIYHHTGKILRRISEELEPIDVELETTITRSV